MIEALHGRTASAVIEVTGDGLAVWRWLGPLIDADGLPPLADARPPASFAPERDQPLALVPGDGTGWSGPLGLAVHRDGRDATCDLRVARIERGEERLTVHLADARARVELVQRLWLDPSGEAMLCAAELRNVGETPLDVAWLAAATLPLPPDCAGLRGFLGRHNAEYSPAIEPMPAHAWLREQRGGLTGHAGPPGLFVQAAGADWHEGRVLGVQLAWSGNHRIEVRRLDDGGWALVAGAWLAPGEVRLAPGERLATPELMIAASDRGLNGAIQAMHAAVRARGPATTRARPVHANSWEACYFDHDEARARDLATEAAALGAERFVLDDGWFRGRDGEHAGLGDWEADPRKYPDGLGPLAAHVRGLGLEFGLWVEPEMVSPDSDLFRAHPDWVLADAGRPSVTARHQLVLDLGRDEVRDHLFGALDRLLRELPIGYLKWDHNRALAPATGADRRPGFLRQTRGTYALIDRLRAAHPGVEIEAVAGGGGRTDAGMAMRAERFWTSDTIDAVARIAMQRGFLHFMPPERMGAHVGASPAHATGRAQAMAFRAAVALPGHLGLELDPGAVTPADRAVLAAWIARYKALRDRLHHGRVWLGEGADGLVWQAHGQADDLLLLAYRAGPASFARPAPLPLPPLAGTPRVRARLLATASDRPARDAPLFAALRGAGVVWPGDWLARAGLPMPVLDAEDCALFALEAA